MERVQAEKSEAGRKMRRLESELARQGIQLAAPVRDADELLDAAKKRRIYLERLEAKEQRDPGTEGES
jgi:hypothetical protein